MAWRGGPRAPGEGLEEVVVQAAVQLRSARDLAFRASDYLTHSSQIELTTVSFYYIVRIHRLLPVTATMTS